MMLKKDKIEFLPFYIRTTISIHTPYPAKFGEDVISVKGIPLIGWGCYYTCQTGYIPAVILNKRLIRHYLHKNRRIRYL